MHTKGSGPTMAFPGKGKKRNETKRKEKGRVKPIFTRPPVCGMSRSLLRTIPAHLLVGFSVDLFAC